MVQEILCQPKTTLLHNNTNYYLILATIIIITLSFFFSDSRKDHLTIFSKSQPPKKRRKSRTAFTNQQIYELEKRFLYQKYLTPADRDEIAHQLGLSNAQVITWFQNRRAKLKRDLEELKADVNAAKTLTGVNGDSFGNLEELQFFQRYGMKKQEQKESSS